MNAEIKDEHKVTKQRLQDVCTLPVLTAKEALDFLGWEYTEGESRFDDIRCCGEPVECSGFFGGTEDLECKKCGKRMHDLFGVTPVSNSTATVLNPNDYDCSDNRHWVAIIPETGKGNQNAI